MNTISPEMLCELSVLERQHSRQKWQQEQLFQQQQQSVTYFGENCGFMSTGNDQCLDEMLVNGAMKPDPGLETGWTDTFASVLNYGNGSELETNYGIPRTVSCPPNVAAALAEVAASKGPALSSANGKESFKKRKADKTQNLKVISEENSQKKKMKGCAEESSKITEQNSNSKSSTTTATNNSKGTAEVPKTDYIHVRARRGQATDSHSLAERVRREKISERMKYLQDLVPGCNKITGKAGMLDEIINYVQSLQRQVEFLSMKLAVINPRLDFDMDNYLTKEIFPGCTSSGPTIGVSSDMVNPTQLQFNPLPQGVMCSSSEMCANPTEATLRRTISAPVSLPETFLDSSCLNQIQQLTWEAAELQNLYNMEYQQGRSTPFISQSLTGFLDIGHVKMEM